jgi:hypothetical protein
MHSHTSLHHALAAEHERALREKARHASSPRRGRLPRRLRGTTATD